MILSVTIAFIIYNRQKYKKTLKLTIHMQLNILRQGPVPKAKRKIDINQWPEQWVVEAYWHPRVGVNFIN